MSFDEPAPWAAMRAGLLKLIETVDESMDADPGPDPDPDPDPIEGFKVFEIIDHHNMPDLAALGMINLKIWYEGAVFDVRDDRPQTGKTVSFQDVNLTSVADAGRNSPAYSVLDIERWADKHTWRVPKPNVDRYIEAMRVYRRNLKGGHKGCLYSILPVRNYWDAVADPNSADYKQWQKWNDEVAPIVPNVDMIMPSLYTFHDKNDPNKFPVGGWVTYARANIEEARRIGLGKPVYPVLWPRFHPGNAGEIPGDYWRVQLDTCAKYADGVVIWDDRTSDKTDWSNLGDWWDVTEAWLKEIDAAG